MKRFEPRIRRSVSILEVFRPLAAWRGGSWPSRSLPVLKPKVFHTRPAPQTFQQMLAKLMFLGMAAFALGGLVMIFSSYSRSGAKEQWEWEHRDIRKNFMPIYSVEENERRFKEEFDKTSKDIGFESTTPQPPPSNRSQPRLPGETTPPVEPPKEEAPLPGDPAAEREAREVKLLSQLTLGRWITVEDEVAQIPTFTPFQDWRPQFRSHLKSEWDANKGRQAPPYEQLALRLLRRIPVQNSEGRAAYDAKLEKGKFWFGVGKEAVNAYRGRVFEVEGRLFDLYEVKLDPPAVLADGSTCSSYFEAVIAFLRGGNGLDELPITQQQVLVQFLQCPQGLKPFINTKASVSQEDELCKQAVFVRCTGVHLRNFIYNRPVAPFHEAEKPVLSQALLPLILSGDIEPIKRDGYQLTDELLQQVRDSTREDISYVQDEAAYYATLAQAANPADKPKVVPEIAYFDLANAENGPKYRGQGVHVYGMLGDNYAPVVLPPNISGQRRVFRCFVAGSLTDLQTPNRWLVDMVDLPPGLEARAPVVFDGRYYRNVFETQDNKSVIRPLLVVHHVERHYTTDRSQDWIFAVVLIAGALVMFIGLAWFLFSDRRAMNRFEQQNMARLRERIEKQGGLKLKPLPGAKEAAPPAAEDKPAQDKPSV